MRKLFYMGLESYEARYTLQLQEWNQRVFKSWMIDHHIVQGQEIDNSKNIVTGSVLDAHGRSYYSLSQTMKLVELMKQGQVTSDDVIFYEDMFTPGIECLPYIMQQSPPEYRPKVFVRCLAQTIDPDDFLNREGMFDWMRSYEKMIDHVVDGILVASEEMVSHLRIAGFKAPIYVTGLPFGKSEVLERIGTTKLLPERKRRVCFASRWDDEKQPYFYMDLARRYYNIDPTVEFALLTGHPEVKSNNPKLVNALDKLDGVANFRVYTGLSKNEYYGLLADSCVLFNCALQDWVSNTVSEADAAGCLTLFPAYRSFPEVFSHCEHHMYIPWSLPDATNKLRRMFNDISVGDLSQYLIGHVSDYQDGTISRTLEVLTGRGELYARNTLDYRKYVAQRKF